MIWFTALFKIKMGLGKCELTHLTNPIQKIKILWIYLKKPYTFTYFSMPLSVVDGAGAATKPALKSTWK